MKSFFKLTLFSGFIMCVFLGSNVHAQSHILVDDFSFTNPYVYAWELNPYFADAGYPLWGNTGDRFFDAFHTNNLGFYTASGPNDGTAQIEWGGYRSYRWDATQNTWWWYTLLTLDSGAGTNLSDYHYLTMRVKGTKGKINGDQGERFQIKLDDMNNNQHVVYIDSFVTEGITNQWQTVRIPLNAFSNFIDLTQTKAITLVFHASDVRNTGVPGEQFEEIAFDDIAFAPECDYPPMADGVTKVSSGSVKVQNKKLFVNDEPYFIKGVAYEPIPVGQTPMWAPTEPYSIHNAQRDFPLLSQIGVNTIRTWGKINDELTTYGTNPFNIKVCASFWVSHSISFLNDFATTRIKQEFVDYVTEFKDEPSLLMWIIGNENNLTNGYDWRWYAFANELAKAAYAIEGSNFHPVSIVEGDKPSIGSVALGSDDAHLNYIDLIGYNSYRGKTFTDFFDVFSSKTGKALWISEYGVDAWHSYSHVTPWDGVINEELQSYYDVSAWVDIVRHQDKNVGGTVMSFADGWWKDPYYFMNDDWSQPQDPKHLLIKDYSGSPLGGLPDTYSNEEWWGIVKYDENNLTEVIPRQVFHNLYSTTIGGKALNANGQPLCSVDVVLSGEEYRTTKTDEQGLYQFTQLYPGNYQVNVLAPGFNSVSVEVNYQETKVVDF